MLIFHFNSAKKFRGTVLVERPARGRKIFENKKTSRLRKRGMEEIRRAAQKQIGRSGLILLFAEKRPGRGADECIQTGILTSASNLIPPSRFASVALEIVAVTVAQPSRNFTGFPDI